MNSVIWILVLLFAILSVMSIIQEDVCRLPKQVGYCKASFPRYYFDHEKNECVYFIYGGCMGNDNNFKTEEECERVCKNSKIQELKF
ncbi:PI-stichotoxin-She2a-like [Argiope bruennichi]|uniref:PI-stichotoxin-She2a-like n=1 Tax=Argiope bruennichi TaxID=94029 RepID=UPI0024940078|nr:PI-stichotoxin-She2a-like [Argiope bruennichi]